jgi:hypothetical protein
MSTQKSTIRLVDHSALRTNQVFIIGLLVLAFVLDFPPLVAFVTAVMLLGTFAPKLALFKAVYASLLRPARVIRPDMKEDNPEPHLFAQGVGGIVLTVAMLAFVAGAATIGWALVWVVVALAALNLFAGVCVGCMMYYQFHRLGVPGFTRAPVRHGER